MAADHRADDLTVPADVAGSIYEAAESRRSVSNQLMWQVPALSLGAQSFLLTVALGAGTSLPGRLVACAVGVGAALATAQLMLKHRFHEISQSVWLEDFWDDQGWPPGRNPHRRARSAKDPGNDHTMLQPRYGRWLSGKDLNGAFRRIVDAKSPTLWIRFFVALAAIDVAVAVLAVFEVIE